MTADNAASVKRRRGAVDLNKVAEVYLTALAESEATGTPRRPAQAVADYLGLGLARAGNYIRQARDAGIMPEAERGSRLGYKHCPTCGAPPSRWGVSS